MLRLDEEARGPVPEAEIDRLLGVVLPRLAGPIRAVILSDYAKGVLGDRVCREVIGEARRRGLPVLVDPKGRDFRKYAGATALTPNRHEMELAAGLEPHDDEAMHHAGRRAWPTWRSTSSW